MAKLLSFLKSRIAILQGLLIVAVGLWIYSPVFHGRWLWDDDMEIFRSQMTLSPSGWWMNWLEPGTLMAYYPIKADVQWIEWRLFGENTFGYHLTNIGLHLCSALLIWRLLSKLGLRFAWLGGLLFVVHPVTVESVAWIAELKNAISLPPILLAMCYWIDYDEHRRPRDYAWAAVWFLIAMLCKVTMALFPAIILLYTWWKYGRVGLRDIKISVPFWIIAVVMAAATTWLQQSKRLANVYLDVPAGLLPRLVLAEDTILHFISKAVWPAGMLPLYEPWLVNSASIGQLLPGVILIAALAWFWTQRKSWGRHVLLGVGFFLINLLPVIVSIQLQYTSMIWSLDHLTYLPLIGLIGLAVAGLEQISLHLSPLPRYIGGAIVAMGIIILACGSCLYAASFASPAQLWAYTLSRDPNSATAHTNLGGILMEHHLLGEAAKEYTVALKLNPENSEARTGMGNALFYSGHPAEAIPHFEAALKHNPNYTPAYNSMANAQMQMGDLPAAKATCEEALRVDPNYLGAHCTLALVLAKMGDHSGATAEMETARRLDPVNDKTLATLESLLDQLK